MDWAGIRGAILQWFDMQWDRNLNRYPWRLDPDPFHILIAEVMLKHTMAQTLIQLESFSLFVKAFPTIQSVIPARKREIIRIFKPLGLYNQRTNHILAMAKKICEDHGGIVPDQRAALLELPGVGPYIANAVMTFAHGQNEPPIDGNLRRIAQRAWRVSHEMELDEFYRKLVSPGNFDHRKVYWGLFDIGWAYCRGVSPKCGRCPLKSYCYHFMEKRNNLLGQQEGFGQS